MRLLDRLCVPSRALVAPLCAAAVGAPLLASAADRTQYLLDFDAAVACDATPGASSTCIDRADIGSHYGDVPGIVDVRFDGVAKNDVENPMNWGSTGFNDLVGVAYGNSGEDNFAAAEIVIESLDGHPIRLLGFDLGAWLNQTRRSQWTILDYGTGVELARTGTANDPLVWIGERATATSPTRSTPVALDLTSDTGFRIQWGPGSWNVGIDNVRFEAGPFPQPPVPIPEPSTRAAAMVGMAAALLLLGTMVDRRRRPAR
jgi:hypothetical protein